MRKYPKRLRGGGWGIALYAMAAFILLSAVAPAHAADNQVTGELRVEGRVSLSGATAEGSALSVFGLVVPTLTDGTDLTVESPKGTICYGSKTFVVTQTPLGELRTEDPLQTRHACEEFTNIRLTSEPAFDPEGYVGFYPETMSAEFDMEGNAAFEPRFDSQLTSKSASGGGATADRAKRAAYIHEVRRAHIWGETAGGISGNLSGDLAVRGLHLLGTTDQGRVTYRTGMQKSSDGLGQMRVSYVFMTLDSARFSIASPEPFAVAMADADARTEVGRLEFVAFGGTIRSASASYHPRDGEESLDGAFAFQLAPLSATKNTGTLALSGTLLTTTMARVPLPVPATHAGEVPWFIVGLIGVVLSSAVAGGIILRRRLRARRPKDAKVAAPQPDRDPFLTAILEPAQARAPPKPVVVPILNAEDEADESGLPPRSPLSDLHPGLSGDLEKAALAALREDWENALYYLRRIKTWDAGNAELRSAEALYLRRLGRPEQAIAAYEEAVALGDKLAWMGAAISAVEAGDMDLAISFLRALLKEDATFIGEVEAETLLAPLWRRADFVALVEDARQRVRG